MFCSEFDTKKKKQKNNKINETKLKGKRKEKKREHKPGSTAFDVWLSILKRYLTPFFLHCNKTEFFIKSIPHVLRMWKQLQKQQQQQFIASLNK